MKQNDCIYHQIVPYHSEQQAKMFFASARDAGMIATEAKERAKKKFKHDCFNKITKDEMKWLIDSLQKRIYDQGRKENKSMGKSTEGTKG